MTDAIRSGDQTIPQLNLEDIDRRLATRTPEQASSRQARLDGWYLGREAMTIGEQHLATGDLKRAREFFVIAARHRAPDAKAMLSTVDTLIAAANDPKIADIAAGTALAADPVDTRMERDFTVQRAREVAQQLDEIQADVEQVATAAKAKVVTTARKTAPKIAAASTAAEAPLEVPPYRAVLVVDTKQFGSNTDAEQEVLAHAIPEVVAMAFERAGLAHVWDNALFPHNTGDGFGIGFDTRYLPAVVTKFFDELERVLAERDGRLRPYGRRTRLRMRASLNVGPVRESERPGEVAVVGNTVIATHRLLDAAPVREILTRSDPDATFLSVALSQRVFEDVLASEYAVLPPSKVVPRRVQVKEFAGTVYLYVPNPSGDLLRDGFGDSEPYQAALADARFEPKPVQQATTINKNTIRAGTHYEPILQVGQLRGEIHQTGQHE